MAPTSKKIFPVARDRWPQTIDTFNKLNKGRRVRIERYGTGAEHEHMETDTPLFSVTYNASGKGDELVIATGKDRAENEYRVEAPEELWVEPALQEKGQAMEIVGRDGRHLTISLE